MGRVDDDLKVVVQFLGDIPAQLPGHNLAWIGIEAGNSEVHIVLVVENANFGLFRWRLPFKRLPLEKICDWTCHLPGGIVERAIKLRGMLDARGLGNPSGLLGSRLPLLSLRATLLLGVEERRS